MRPVTGVVGLALKRSSPGKSGIRAVDRQPVAITQCRAETTSPRSVRTSQRCAVRSKGLCNPRVELDIAAQIEAIGDMVGVAQDLRLRGKQLAPLPFLLSSCENDRSTACSRRRSARRDSGSSTRCHRRPCRPRTRGPTCRDRAGDAACTSRRNRRRRSPHRRCWAVLLRSCAWAPYGYWWVVFGTDQ